MNDLGKDVMEDVGNAEKTTSAYYYVKDIKYLLKHVTDHDVISKANDTIKELIDIAKEMVSPNAESHHATLLERAFNLYNTFVTSVKQYR